MLLSELIAQLQELARENPDLEVILSNDDELNGYHSVNEVSLQRVDDRDESIYLAELTPELVDQGYSEDDLGDPASTRLVVLI